MSTRSQIAFYRNADQKKEEWDALVYRHWDGYPEAVLPDIVPILEDFNKNRGLSDVEYASALLVAQLKKDFLNIGISKNFHGDIEYVYCVFPDRLEAWACQRGEGDRIFDDMKPFGKLLQTHIWGDLLVIPKEEEE